MIQDIFPHVYHNEYVPHPPRAEDCLLCFTEAGLLCGKNPDGTVALPRCGEYGGGQYLFSVDESSYYLREEGVLPAPAGMEYVSSRTLRDYVPDETLFACAAGESLWRWYTQNRFCGCCGGTMDKGTEERSLVWSRCGHTVYPKICPAVIVAVCHGGRLLLTRYAGRPFRRYALVAGFNEIGESIEDTVRREVREEVGLEVQNLRFYRSQPWVYTDSLLMGFFCDLDGSDEIHRQESELAEAGWFSRTELPEDHSAISLTGEMIELVRRGEDPR